VRHLTFTLPTEGGEGERITLRVVSDSHLFGELIAQNAFPEEYDELLDVLGRTQLPLRSAGPFTRSGRPLTPKRQKKRIAGREAYALFPIDQSELNATLLSRLRDLGWTSEPIAAGRELGVPADLALRGDFSKKGVFVEVEFGNSASLYRDLFKFQIANRSGVGEVGVLITATTEMGKFFDSGIATYEQAVGLLPYMRIGIQMPIWLIGLEPNDWTPIAARYEEMYEVATENGVPCHTFDEVRRAGDEIHGA
jgi:hypothetical protein